MRDPKPRFWGLRSQLGRAAGLVASVSSSLILSSGCSWIAVKSPARPGEPGVPCTDSRAAPVADTVMASLGALLVVGAVVVFAADASFKGEGAGIASAYIGVPMVSAGLVMAPTYGFSARYGFAATRECRGQPVELRERAPAWKAAGPATVAVSPVRAGVVIDSLGSGTLGGFSLFSDFDYYLTPNLAVGGLMNLGLGPNINSGIGGSGLMGFGLGPQLKLLYASPDHVPFLRLALPFRMFPGAYGGGSTYGIALVQLGAGYRYWFHRRVGLGLDADFVPTLRFGAAPSSFLLGLQFSSGVNLRF